MLPPPPPSRPTNIRWLVFALGGSVSWVLYLHRYTFGLIKPKLQAEFGWDAQQLGMLDSAFSVCYGLFQFPGGVLADLIGSHLFLTGSIVLWSLALAMHAWAPDLGWMRIARGLFGVGQCACFAALSRLTRNWFPTSIRTFVQGWIGVFFGRMGGACAGLIFATLLIGELHFPWQTAVYLFAGVGLALALAFVVLVRDLPRRHPLVNEAEVDLIEGSVGEPTQFPSRTGMSVSGLLRRTSRRSLLNMLALNLQTTLSTFADAIYPMWIPLFLAEVHAMKYQEMGIYSMLPLLGGACGGAVGGLLNDATIRFTGNRRWSRSAIGFLGKGSACILLLTALLFYDRPYVFCGMLFFVKFIGDWSLAGTWGTVTDIGGRQSASVFAFNNSIASIGDFLAGVVFGAVVLHFGWKPVFRLVAGTYGVCAFSWLLINCTIPVLSDEPDVDR